MKTKDSKTASLFTFDRTNQTPDGDRSFSLDSVPLEAIDSSTTLGELTELLELKYPTASQPNCGKLSNGLVGQLLGVPVAGVLASQHPGLDLMLVGVQPGSVLLLREAFAAILPTAGIRLATPAAPTPARQWQLGLASAIRSTTRSQTETMSKPFINVEGSGAQARVTLLDGGWPDAHQIRSKGRCMVPSPLEASGPSGVFEKASIEGSARSKPSISVDRSAGQASIVMCDGRGGERILTDHGVGAVWPKASPRTGTETAGTRSFPVESHRNRSEATSVKGESSAPLRTEKDVANKVGRPSKLTPELQKRLVSAIKAVLTSRTPRSSPASLTGACASG